MNSLLTLGKESDNMDKINFNNHDYGNLFYGRASWLMSSAPNVFQEADSIEKEDEEIDEDLENVDPDELHSDLEDKHDSEDENGYEDNVEDEEVEEKKTVIEKPESDEDYDLKDFGNHGGPDVPNNQYNEQDVEILNKLISSESDAINDYFDATTNTVDTNLSRLYGDIGREERFHLEQLLYAKSLITGEKYEPKDPEVKKEYEELIGQGMDEDTAIVTTIDKISINKPMQDEEFEALQADVAETESYLMQSELLTEMIMESTFTDLAEEYSRRMDFYMEDVLNVNTLSRREKNGVNPIRWLIEQFLKFIKFLRKLGKLIREQLARRRAKQARVREYIKKYGIGALFQKGYYFYTYNDANQTFDLNPVYEYADMVYRIAQMIGNKCGLNINASDPIAKYRSQITQLNFSSIEKGIERVNGLLLTKRRVAVTDQNEEYLINCLFGYTSGNKLQHHYVSDVNGNGNPIVKTEKLSTNFYNMYVDAIESITLASEYCRQLLVGLQQLEGDPTSIYHRNYNMWKKSLDYIKSIMNGFSKIIAALNHDINTMLKIDDQVIAETNEHDKADQNHQRYEGDTHKFGAAKQQDPNAKPSVISRFA